MATATNELSSPTPETGKGWKCLAGLLGLMIALRLFAGVIQVPPFVAGTLTLVLSAIFIAVPIIGLYYAAQDQWSWKVAAALVVVGVALQATLTPLAAQATVTGFARVGWVAMAQAGLLLWCFGLGALVASLFKDKNLLLPVAVFLAGFDVFLVTYPLGPVQQVLQKQPEVFKSVAYAVPKAVEQGQAVGVQIGAYVGPADFIFLSMFFVALYRFRMRIAQTLPWMVGALMAYLFVVLFMGDVRLGPIELSALPALLPIGAVVLACNLREFQLTKDEWGGTIVVSALAVGLAAFGIMSASRKPQALPTEPSPSAGAPGVSRSAETPALVVPNPRP